MSQLLSLPLDRHAGLPLTEQIRAGLRAAIVEGRLAPGARLPSWRDLAAQLGVARGTVRLAYEGLVDEQLIVSSGAAGSHVAPRLPVQPGAAAPPEDCGSTEGFAMAPVGPATFQLGVPAQDAFPAKAWSRILARAARAAALQAVGYPDFCGEDALRKEVVAYLAVARGLACTPQQVFITGGYTSALGIVLGCLARSGAQCWVEDPGLPFARHALRLAGVEPVPVSVDGEGLDVDAGRAAAPGAALALVTAGQQAPLGVTLSLRRRHALLDWASQADGWIIEDDYLGELQLDGRAAPALASLDQAGRVFHIGTFSKTITPALRLGFLVVPAPLVRWVRDYVTVLAPAPAPLLQQAVVEFMRDGHYLRHLRRMKRIYVRRRQALAACLASQGEEHCSAGLAVLHYLPRDCDDTEVVRLAGIAGLAPVPLSPWFSDPGRARPGLLLGVTNLAEERVAESWRRLSKIIQTVRPR